MSLFRMLEKLHGCNNIQDLGAAHLLSIRAHQSTEPSQNHPCGDAQDSSFVVEAWGNTNARESPSCRTLLLHPPRIS